MIVALLVRHTLFIFHLLLSRVHVEAPLSGSIIVAELMLKVVRYVGSYFEKGRSWTAFPRRDLAQ